MLLQIPQLPKESVQLKKIFKCQANANWSNNGYKTDAIGFVTLKVILE